MEQSSFVDREEYHIWQMIVLAAIDRAVCDLNEGFVFIVKYSMNCALRVSSLEKCKEHSVTLLVFVCSSPVFLKPLPCLWIYTQAMHSGHKLFPLFYRKRGSFEKIVHSDTVNWGQDSNRELLRAMMMTACDVAAITKPWEIQYKVCNMYC